MAKSTSRLGRGLGSLISGGTDLPLEETATMGPDYTSSDNPTHSNAQMKATENPELLEINTRQIVPNPYQPRKTIEGLLQPIVVRKILEDYQLIAGERRWRAHQFLGREKILARIMTASEISSASLSLIENLQREGLNPIEESMGYHSLVNEFGLTQAKVAERVGKSRSYITNTINL